MAGETQNGLLLLAPLLLQLIGLTFVVVIDPYIRRAHRRVMLLIVAAVLSLIVQNILDYRFDTRGAAPYARTLAGIYGYCVRPVILMLFFYIVSDEREHWAAWGLIGINTAIHLTALFSDVCFSISADGVFRRGPLGYTCHVVSAILLVQLLFMTIREYSRVRRSETWIPVFNALLIGASVVMDTGIGHPNYLVSYLTIAVVSGSVFYYIWLHLQFVRAHERALMAEQRIQIMMSQIQPHFLYNTLSTIQALCRVDPRKAFETTERFGAYLRRNIDSLSQPSLIPIQKELEHTRVYAEIERVRFPSITVEYDIGDDEFSVPALTVQPLVENAIRHGVRIRENGLVSVVTRRGPGYHEVVIRDNGKGFDAQSAVSPDETHIGIRNVRERLETMCGGTLDIDSRPGEGTTVTIRIPVK